MALSPMFCRMRSGLKVSQQRALILGFVIGWVPYADSKKFEYGPGTISGDCPYSQAFVVGRWS